MNFTPGLKNYVFELKNFLIKTAFCIQNLANSKASV